MLRLLLIPNPCLITDPKRLDIEPQDFSFSWSNTLLQYSHIITYDTTQSEENSVVRTWTHIPLMCYTQPNLSPSPRLFLWLSKYVLINRLPHEYLPYEIRPPLNIMDSSEVLSSISHLSFVYLSLQFTQDLQVELFFVISRPQKVELIRKEHVLIYHLLTFTSSTLGYITVTSVLWWQSSNHKQEVIPLSKLKNLNQQSFPSPNLSF